MATPRKELEAYRERIFEELKLRSIRLKEIDSALASNQYLLANANSSHGLRSGNTLRVLAGASHKAKLKREEERLERRRREAAADLKRAEERLVDVDRELEELDSREATGQATLDNDAEKGDE